MVNACHLLKWDFGGRESSSAAECVACRRPWVQPQDCTGCVAGLLSIPRAKQACRLAVNVVGDSICRLQCIQTQRFIE